MRQLIIGPTVEMPTMLRCAKLSVRLVLAVHECRLHALCKTRGSGCRPKLLLNNYCAMCGLFHRSEQCRTTTIHLTPETTHGSQPASAETVQSGMVQSGDGFRVRRTAYEDAVLNDDIADVILIESP